MAGVKKKSPQKATKDAVVVSMVRKAGAIVLLVSNTPELCLNWETSNKVTGTTRNPYDTRKIPGGSSGGEVCIYLNCIRLLTESFQETLHYISVWKASRSLRPPDLTDFTSDIT